MAVVTPTVPPSLWLAVRESVSRACRRHRQCDCLRSHRRRRAYRSDLLLACAFRRVGSRCAAVRAPLFPALPAALWRCTICLSPLAPHASSSTRVRLVAALTVDDTMRMRGYLLPPPTHPPTRLHTHAPTRALGFLVPGLIRCFESRLFTMSLFSSAYCVCACSVVAQLLDG